MSGASNCSGSGDPGPCPGSKPQPESYAKRSKGDVIRPFPRMQINNEERRRREQARLRADQPAIGAPVVRAGTLVALLRVAAHVAAVRTQRTRVLRGPADVEQRIPLMARVGMLSLGEHDEGGDAGGGEPLAVVDDGSLERCTLVFGRQSSVIGTDDR